MSETLKKIKKVLKQTESKDLFVVDLHTKEIVCMSIREWKEIENNKTHMVIK